MVIHSNILDGKSHGQRSLVSYSPWGCKSLDMTERLLLHFTYTYIHTYIYICVCVCVCVSVCTNKKRLKTCLLKGYNSEFLKWGRSVGVIHCFRAIITTASLPTAIISILHWWAASVNFMYITSNSYRKPWP